MARFNFGGRWPSRRELLRGAVITVFLAGMLWHIPHAVAAGRWFGHHGHWRGGHHHFETADAAREHVQKRLRRALRGLDASDQQQEQAAAIVARVVDDVFPLFEDHRNAHQAFAGALQEANIDRAALQELRQREVERWEAASAKLVDGLADLAEVLTAEQRRELIEHMERFHHRS